MFGLLEIWISRPVHCTGSSDMPVAQQRLPPEPQTRIAREWMETKLSLSIYNFVLVLRNFRHFQALKVQTPTCSNWGHALIEHDPWYVGQISMWSHCFLVRSHHITYCRMFSFTCVKNRNFIGECRIVKHVRCCNLPVVECFQQERNGTLINRCVHARFANVSFFSDVDVHLPLC